MKKPFVFKRSRMITSERETQKIPSLKKQPLSEAIKQQAALYKKYKEYSEKTTEELKEMFPILGGGYKKVCYEILVQRKFEELKANQSEELPEGEI